MELSWAIKQLTTHSFSISQLCQAVTDPQARIKPDPQSWSILEVIDHLYEEEREDFRKLIDLTFHESETEWPPLDLDQSATEQAYQSDDVRQGIAKFAAERERSLEWMQGLHAPDWERICTHPRGFQMRAGDVLAAWVAHDVLHLRQLVELHFHLVTLEAQPYSVQYAGDW